MNKLIDLYYKVIETFRVEDDDSSIEIKEATFNVTYFLAVFFGLLYSLIYYFLGAHLTALLEMSQIAIFFPVILLLKKRNQYYLCINIFIFLYISVLTTCAYLTGGVYSPSTLWLIIPPFLANVLLSAKEVIAWGLITVLNISIIGLVHFYGWMPQTEVKFFVKEFYAFSFIALIVFITGFMLVSVYMRLKIKIKADEFEKDAQRNEYLATFAQVTAGIAHEINNPLTVALGNAKRISKLIEQDSFDKQEIVNNSGKIVKSIERTSKIISSMKNLSRDGSRDDISTFTVKELIEDTTNVFLNKLSDNSIDFSIDFNSLEELKLNTHRTQIGQVLFNLIKNSYDEVYNLDKPWIKVSVKESNGTALIKVLDSGGGVRPDVINKVFSPFYSTKSVGEGTGLGLSLSLSMMKKNHGDLFIDKSSKNTCFVMSVPIQVDI